MNPKHIVAIACSAVGFLGIMILLGYFVATLGITGSQSTGESTAETIGEDWAKKCPDGAPLLQGESFLRDHPECREYYQLRSR